MADGFDLDLGDLNRLAVDLGQASSRAMKAARVVLEKTTADIEANAKAIVPIDTGNLKNSIGHTTRGLSAEIGPTASYGAYVEYGTTRKGPAAFMGPSFDRYAPGFEAAMGQIGESAVGQ